MRSLKSFFEFLNDVDFPYVVLRNFDHLPYSVELGHHSDLDLLVYDIDHFLEIIREAEPEHPRPRVRFKIPIDDSFIYADVRYVGDGYYPRQFQENILKTREFWPEKHIWTPDPVHHQIALAYHAVHHKSFIAEEYRRHLGDGTIKEFLEALKSSPVGWVEPEDPTVGRFHRYWKGATAEIEKADGVVSKRQVGFMEYPLIYNESLILIELEGDCFPSHCGLTTEGVLRMTDCGDPLTAENMPENWRDQLDGILEALKKCGVQHRDIRPDNLMVKDGVIRLIDFGWAVKDGITDEKIAKTPPSCLGFPFKPSDGYDDAFSMRAVARHFEFLIDDKKEKDAAKLS